MLEKLINAVKPRASVLSASESYARSIQDLVSAPTVKKPQALNEQVLSLFRDNVATLR